MTTVTTLFSVNAATIALSGTSTATAAVPLPAIGGTIRLVNEGPNAAYVAVTISGTLATLPGTTPACTCTPVESGEDIVFGIPSDARQMISVVCRAAQTCTLLVSVSEGV